MTAQPKTSNNPSPAPAREPVRLPRVWAVTGARAGDRAQILALAEALGWPVEEKRLAHNLMAAMPNLLLGGSRLSLKARAADPLEAPWPDLVIASGRRSAPIVRWIQQRSGGRARLVHIGRPWAPLKHFDLIVSTPQYHLPQAPNVLHNTLSLNRVDPRCLEAAAASWAPRLADLPQPMIALIVGGDARPYVLDPVAAAQLGRAANDLAKAEGGSLLVTTSRRTRPDAVAALFTAVSVPCFRHDWAAGGENPYFGFLALAESLIVTGDSASMLSEACATGKPLRVFGLPEKPDFRMRLVRRFRELAKGLDGRKSGRLARLFDRLVDLGLVSSLRDMTAFHQSLADRGLAVPLGQSLPGPAAPVPDERALTAARVRALFGPEQG